MGANWRSVVPALGRAALVHREGIAAATKVRRRVGGWARVGRPRAGQAWWGSRPRVSAPPPHAPPSWCRCQARLDAVAAATTAAYYVAPDLGVLCAMLLEHPLDRLADLAAPVPGELLAHWGGSKNEKLKGNNAHIFSHAPSVPLAQPPAAFHRVWGGREGGERGGGRGNASWVDMWVGGVASRGGGGELQARVRGRCACNQGRPCPLPSMPRRASQAHASARVGRPGRRCQAAQGRALCG